MMPLHIEHFPVLQTELLFLEELERKYANSLLQLFTDKRVTEYYHVYPMKDENDAAAIIEKLRNRFVAMEAMRWAIVLKESNDFIGTIGFNSFNEGHRSAVVFALMPQHWGNGYISEALKKVIDFGFTELSLNRIEAEVMPGNVASEKTVLRAGFKHEGLLRDWILWDGQYYDAHIYALLRSDWKKMTQ